MRRRTKIFSHITKRSPPYEKAPEQMQDPGHRGAPAATEPGPGRARARSIQGSRTRLRWPIGDRLGAPLGPRAQKRAISPLDKNDISQ